jgi:hypothetical protein
MQRENGRNEEGGLVGSKENDCSVGNAGSSKTCLLCLSRAGWWGGGVEGGLGVLVRVWQWAISLAVAVAIHSMWVFIRLSALACG